jgi:hypothetical protein
MSYDSKCFDLATHFLDDVEDLPFGQRAAFERQLAQVIQNAIEDFLLAIDVVKEAEEGEI